MNHTPLVTLQSGDPAGLCVVCIPGAGASVVSFLDLAGSLPGSAAVYALQPEGQDAGVDPHLMIETKARHYLAEIQRHLGGRRFHLLGHSYGGWIAFDVALRMKAIDHELSSLIVVDSEVPNGLNGPAVDVPDADVAEKLLGAYEQLAGQVVGLRPLELVPLDSKEATHRLHLQLVKLRLLPRASEPGVVSEVLSTFARCVRTWYKPSGAYEGATHLVLVDDPKKTGVENEREADETIAGWRRIAPGLVVVRAPGNHMSVIRLPHVAAISSLLLRLERQGAVKR